MEFFFQSALWKRSGFLASLSQAVFHKQTSQSEPPGLFVGAISLHQFWDTIPQLYLQSVYPFHASSRPQKLKSTSENGLLQTPAGIPLEFGKQTVYPAWAILSRLLWLWKTGYCTKDVAFTPPPHDHAEKGRHAVRATHLHEMARASRPWRKVA